MLCEGQVPTQECLLHSQAWHGFWGWWGLTRASGSVSKRPNSQGTSSPTHACKFPLCIGATRPWLLAWYCVRLCLEIILVTFTQAWRDRSRLQILMIPAKKAWKPSDADIEEGIRFTHLLDIIHSSRCAHGLRSHVNCVASWSIIAMPSQANKSIPNRLHLVSLLRRQNIIKILRFSTLISNPWPFVGAETFGRGKDRN